MNRIPPHRHEGVLPRRTGAGRGDPISRVLSRGPVSRPTEAIIPLGPPSPTDSSGQPGSSGGQPSSAPLFGLAPSGACPADPVTRIAVRSYRTGSPLPDPEGPPTPRRRSTRGMAAARCRTRTWRYALCCAVLRVAPTRRYLAPCPVELGLSSRGPKPASDHPDPSDPVTLIPPNRGGKNHQGSACRPSASSRPRTAWAASPTRSR